MVWGWSVAQEPAELLNDVSSLKVDMAVMRQVNACGIRVERDVRWVAEWCFARPPSQRPWSCLPALGRPLHGTGPGGNGDRHAGRIGERGVEADGDVRRDVLVIHGDHRPVLPGFEEAYQSSGWSLCAIFRPGGRCGRCRCDR